MRCHVFCTVPASRRQGNVHMPGASPAEEEGTPSAGCATAPVAAAPGPAAPLAAKEEGAQYLDGRRIWSSMRTSERFILNLRVAGWQA